MIWQPLTDDEQRTADRRVARKLADITEDFRAAVRTKAAQGLALPTGFEPVFQP